MVLGSFVFYLWWFSVSRRVIYLKPPEASEERKSGLEVLMPPLKPYLQ